VKRTRPRAGWGRAGGARCRRAPTRCRPDPSVNPAVRRTSALSAITNGSDGGNRRCIRRRGRRGHRGRRRLRCWSGDRLGRRRHRLRMGIRRRLGLWHLRPGRQPFCERARAHRYPPVSRGCSRQGHTPFARGRHPSRAPEPPRHMVNVTAERSRSSTKEASGANASSNTLRRVPSVGAGSGSRAPVASTVTRIPSASGRTSIAILPP
jgi:hypothetical protein